MLKNKGRVLKIFWPYITYLLYGPWNSCYFNLRKLSSFNDWNQYLLKSITWYINTWKKNNNGWSCSMGVTKTTNITSQADILTTYKFKHIHWVNGQIYKNKMCRSLLGHYCSGPTSSLKVAPTLPLHFESQFSQNVGVPSQSCLFS